MMKKLINLVLFVSILTLFSGCSLKSFIFDENEVVKEEQKINLIEKETKVENDVNKTTLKSITSQTLSELEKNTSKNKKVQKVTKTGNMFVFKPEKIISKCSDNKYDVLTSVEFTKSQQSITKSIEVVETNNDVKTVITLDDLKSGVIYSVESCINDKGGFDTRVVTKFLEIIN